MDRERVFDQYSLVPEKALAYGFEKTEEGYVIRRALPQNGFYVVLRIAEGRIDADVYEEPDNELFLPFYTKADGGFVGSVRAAVDKVLEEILESCFVLTDVKALLLDYVHQKYGTAPEAPWGALEEYHTLNTAGRHKWYGLFMLIPYRYLGIKKEGKIHVLNLKARPEDIPSLVDHVHYFPAYHMNKTYWISVLLDKQADVEQIKRLLDDSYAIVEGKR